MALVETHMSWVFLTDAYVYKLKKPIRQDGLDFSTPALRRQNCLEEVRLNRRLAPDTYLGVVAVSRAPDGRLGLDGPGEPVDWLVHMRRLSADRNLDAILRSGRAASEEPGIRAAASHLARFYADARASGLPRIEYLRRLERGVRRDRDTLLQPRYGLSLAAIEAVVASQLAVLQLSREAFDVRADRIVEGHGDLRPEHIWLVTPPAIIDCVEFDPSLRMIDPADDLSFLALECERLGAPQVGAWFFQAYGDATADRPPAAVLNFYRNYRALRRATIAARHLDDPTVADPGPFLARAHQYVDLAARETPTVCGC